MVVWWRRRPSGRSPARPWLIWKFLRTAPATRATARRLGALLHGSATAASGPSTGPMRPDTYQTIPAWQNRMSKLSELQQFLPGATRRGAADPEIRGVAYDSRRVKPGDLFVCVSGFK